MKKFLSETLHHISEFPFFEKDAIYLFQKDFNDYEKMEKVIRIICTMDMIISQLSYLVTSLPIAMKNTNTILEFLNEFDTKVYNRNKKELLEFFNQKLQQIGTFPLFYNKDCINEAIEQIFINKEVKKFVELIFLFQRNMYLLEVCWDERFIKDYLDIIEYQKNFKIEMEN